MLAEWDEAKVVAFAAALNGGVAILVISLFAWLSGLPLLFPSLGPTAFTLFTTPFSASAAPRSVVVGHFVGIVSGWGAWHLMSFINGEAISPTANGGLVCVSAFLAFAVTVLLLGRLSCPHAPACATALIIATGGLTAWQDLLVMAGAVVLVAAQAVCISRLTGVNVPIWRVKDPRSRCSEG